MLVRYAKGMMDEHPKLWHTLVDKMRQSCSMMVYNEEDVIAAYKRAGVDPEDAFDFEHFGCNWPIIPGKETCFCTHVPFWGKHMDPDDWDFIHQEFDSPSVIAARTLEVLQLLAEKDDPALTMDGLFNALRDYIRPGFDTTCEVTLRGRDFMMKEAPGVLLYADCFFKDCITQAKDGVTGGNQYYMNSFSWSGFATAADSLAAVDELVFRQRKLSLKELMDACADDFEGAPEILAMCREVPKLGSDDPHANETAVRLLTLLTEEMDRITAKLDKNEYPRIYFRQSMETDTGHIAIGAALGATPDGRRAGKPVSQNAQPSVGASVNGLTARLMSLSCLPFDRIMSGAQNISIQPKLFESEEGLNSLAAVLGTYLESGGLQIQVSAVDLNDLLDAQKNPDAHRDLTVRVTGYSAVFVDMNKKAQDDIIAREMSGL